MSDTGIGKIIGDATRGISNLNFNTPAPKQGQPSASGGGNGGGIPTVSSSTSSYVEPTEYNMFDVANHVPKSTVVQRPHISRRTRMNLKEKDSVSIMEAFTKPLKTTLDLLDYTKLNEISEEVFERNEQIETFLTDLLERLEYYQASDVLTKQIILGPNIDPSDDSKRFDLANGIGKLVNLCKEWDRIGAGKDYSLRAIADGNEWKRRYTRKEYDIVIQDGLMVHTLLVNSMSSLLKDTVMGDLRRNFSNDEYSGSLTFGLMLQHVINLSESAIDSLKECLINQSLKTIPGENVSLLTRRLHYGLNRLKHNDAFPRNVHKLIFRVMSTSSVLSFHEWITVYRNMTELQPISQRPSFIDLLNSIDEKYKDLCHGNDWCGTNADDHGSAFKFNQGGGSKNGSDKPPQKENKGNPPQDRKGNQQLSIWRPPTKDEAIGDDQFSRVIKKKFMGYCKHCKGTKSGKQGTWTTTHFSPDCTSVGGSGRSSTLMSLNNDSGNGKPKANLAGTTESNSKKLSFKEQLLANGGSDDE